MQTPFNKKIARLNLLSASLIIFFFTAFLVVLFWFTHNKHIEIQGDLLKKTIIEEKKDFVKHIVDRTIDEIDQERGYCRQLLGMDGSTLRGKGIAEVHNYCSEAETQERIIRAIRSTELMDNGYIWINKVLNYDGGDDYAVRLVHPNLPQTEGLLLSTNNVDIKGNTPYKNELEGVKKSGELFINYWFKKKSSEVIAEKLSYVRLYRDYDWIIGSGIYLDDVDKMVADSEQAFQPVFNRTLVAVVLLGSLTAIIAFVIAFFFHRYIKTVIAGFIKENEEKEKVVIGMNTNLENLVRDRTQKIVDSEQKLKESERKYQDLYNNAPDMFASVDISTGLIRECNNTLCEKTGFSRSELLGTPIRDLYHSDSRIQREEVLETFKETGEITDRHLFLCKNDGTRLAVSLNATAVRDSSGNILYSRSAWRDNTEIVKMEQELRQAQKMEAIGTLAGGIAHDFNNILASILGFAELALEDAQRGSELEENIQEIQTAGNRAAALVKQILTFARQSDEVLCPLAVSSIAKELVKFIRSSIPSTIAIESAIDSTSLVMANPAQIHQILMNLCTNSAHAMEQGGGRLFVQVTDVSLDADNLPKGGRPGDFVKITVSDSGEGIAPSIMDSIFEPYFTTKPVGKGTGIGLAVVHGIVNDYGGVINVESSVGVGTTFEIYLPATLEADDEEGEDEAALQGGSERLLVVDDEVPVANVFGRMLTRMGYKVTVCSDSIKALELFKSAPDDYDALLSDMTMPGMTGDRLAQSCKTIRPDLVTVICTGYSEVVAGGESLLEGVDIIVQKPVVKNAFDQVLRSAFAKRSKE